MASQQGNRRDDDLSRALRGAVGSAEFDYAALVTGAHQRAGRIRRRRAIATGAAVAVLGPALVGGAALVLPEILPDGGSGSALTPAGSSDASGQTSAAPTDTAAATQAPPTDEAASTVDPVPTDDAAVPTDEAAPTDDAAVTTAPTAGEAPWQESAPPMPEGGAQPDNEDFPNAWQIPDARPTGVDALDGLGAPQLVMNYPRVAPVMGLMTCDPGRAGGVEPLAGQHFSHYADDQAGLIIDITVTGWEDSPAARDGLVQDAYTLCTWDSGVAEAQPFPGHESDEDYLVFAPEGSELTAAVVRQGDYLIAVTVRDASEGAATQIAAEIAGKSADNLEALDPVHGRD
ncbi:hypothetical protein [Ornithinimicrobium cavernae]|uniref:hypothetical protein n=1 Tax=Ornithinimicrobium cavernae TaxID=2666047 RepID=UPI000D688BB1|nr:hypothetical protein [Ornithinimicrobium cavernae]